MSRQSWDDWLAGNANAAEWQAWHDSRPESVQRLMEEFHPGDSLELPEGVGYIIGYTEYDQLILSLDDPLHNPQATATDRRIYVCASHYRQEEKHADTATDPGHNN